MIHHAHAALWDLHRAEREAMAKGDAHVASVHRSKRHLILSSVGGPEGDAERAQAIDQCAHCHDGFHHGHHPNEAELPEGVGHKHVKIPYTPLPLKERLHESHLVCTTCKAEWATHAHPAGEGIIARVCDACCPICEGGAK